MRLEYELTPEGYRRFNAYFAKNDPATKRKHFSFCIVTPLGFLAFAAAFRLLGDTSGYWAMMAIVGIFLLCVSPSYWNYSIRKRVNKIIKDGKATGLIGPHTLVTEANGVTLITNTMKSEIKWKAINKVVLGDDCVYLHLSDSTAIMVPNCAFDGSGKREQFFEETLRCREQAAGIEALQQV